MLKVSKSHEDYLEAIVMLGGSPDSPIRSVDVAKKLEVSKASVNKAVGVLSEAGLLEHPHYGDITLTDDGYAYGKKVLNRHNTIMSFFVQGLGINPEIAEEEACCIEHVLSDETFERWEKYINEHLSSEKHLG